MRILSLILLVSIILVMAAPVFAGNPPGEKNCWEEKNFKVCVDLETKLPYIVRLANDVQLSWKYWSDRPNIRETEPGLPDLILFFDDNDGFLRESSTQGVWIPTEGWFPLGESPQETAVLMILTKITQILDFG